MHKPTVTVLVTNYNHAKFLPEALQALLDQTWRPLEILVVDDGSTDSSIEVIERFSTKDSLIRLVRNDYNRGAVFSANRGIELASGEYLFWAAADDRTLPGLLDKSMRLLAQYREAGLCSALSRVIDAQGADKGLFPTPVVGKESGYLTPAECLRRLTKHGSWVMGTTTIYKRKILVEEGGFRQELGPFCDGFTHQVVLLRYGACFIPEPLACWRRMETGFAMTTTSNLKRSTEIISCAAELMRSTYKDLFPKDYVSEWTRSSLYNAGVSAWDAVGSQQRKLLNDSRNPLGQAQSLLDRFMLAFLRLSVAVQGFAVKLYFFVRHRPFHSWWQSKIGPLRD